jgi:hypothetical protein
VFEYAAEFVAPPGAATEVSDWLLLAPQVSVVVPAEAVPTAVVWLVGNVFAEPVEVSGVATRVCVADV